MTAGRESWTVWDQLLAVPVVCKRLDSVENFKQSQDIDSKIVCFDRIDIK